MNKNKNTFKKINTGDSKSIILMNTKHRSSSASSSTNSSKLSDTKYFYEYLSEIEAAILKSSSPINFGESEEKIVEGERGIWLNKNEVLNWKGEIPIEDYKVNNDPEPNIILKTTNKTVNYIQELAVRYLKPPTPETPGDIIINCEEFVPIKPAPPIIIRQQPPLPKTPEPIIFREAPPPPPKPIKKKVINISGKKLPPPPRKVIIERLAPLPQKPQSILIERWLPYTPMKRKVILKKRDVKPAMEKPKNVIIQWENPKVIINKQVKYLGIIRADPEEYINRYGNSLIQDRDLPNFVKEIKKPFNISLAAESNCDVHQLEGDVEALELIDLDKEDLGQYKTQIKKFGKKSEKLNKIVNIENLNKLLNQIDNDIHGKISLEEVKNLFMFLNEYFQKSYPMHIIESWINILEHDERKEVKLSDVKKFYDTFFLKT